MQKRLTGLLFSGLLLTTAASAVLAADKPVAIVNGKPISQNTYEHYLAQASSRRPNNSGGVNREAIINELVNRELLHQAAVKKNVEKDKEVAFQLEQLRIDTLIQGLLNNIMSANPVTEADMKKEYEERVVGANLLEYKARHILLKTEDDAKAVIAELDSGAKFEELAKSKSTGPSAKDGGDLGWFGPSQMVPPFSQAVVQMKKGAYTKEPVKTRFGWHVIKLEDSRKRTPPKYEDVKQQLQMVLQNQRIQAYIAELRKTAKVEIK